MRDHRSALARSNWRRLLVCSGLTVLVLGGSQAAALPILQPGATPGLVLVQGAPPDAEPDAQEAVQAPFADLNEVLEATRAKLEQQLGDAAIVAAAAELRKQVEALKEENERLAAELEQADARRTDLEKSSELAEARIAELSKAVDVAVQEAARIDGELTELRQQNAELNDSLAEAQSAREAAQAEAEKTTTDLQAKLEAATGAAEQTEAELAEARKELEATREQLAATTTAREEGEAQMSEMEAAIERTDAESERLETELAAAKEQLGQATGAAVEAERAREEARAEADALRDEAGRVREELAAAKSEIERVESANADLERQMASWRQDSMSAIETARTNLIVMQERIEELNAALGLAKPEEEAAPSASPRPEQAPAGDQSSATTGPPGAVAEPAAPASDRTVGAARSSRSPIELSETELSMVGAAAALSANDRSVARFRANIDELNKRALEKAGVDLFAGVEAVDNDVVHVSTTSQWASIPPAGQLSYLNSLLDYWVAAQNGQGPAAVRIVDGDGEVLLEKSWP
jgi:chromosome segregation ATPase